MPKSKSSHSKSRSVKETNADGDVYTESAYYQSAEKREHYANNHMKGKSASELANDRETAEGLGLTKPGWFVHRFKGSSSDYAYAILGPDNTVYTNKRKAQNVHKNGVEIYIQCQRKDENGNICGAIRTAFATSDVGCNTCGGTRQKVTITDASTIKVWKKVPKPSNTSAIRVSTNLFK